MSHRQTRARRMISHVAAIVLAAVNAACSAAGQSAVASPPTAAASGGVYTAGQASRGAALFTRNCATCHAPPEFSGRIFEIKWDGRPLADFLTFIRTTMPFDEPGRLTPQEYGDIVAYILQLNSYPPGERELPADSQGLEQIRFENPS